jgi:surfeit locus 1 family protein
VNTDSNKRPPAWLLFSVGALLVVQFAALGVWQVNRGLEKRASRVAFNDQSSFTRFVDGAEVRAYQSVEVDGKFVSGQQFLLDNIILNSRYGYYVLTPTELGEGEPLLIVNRGWIERSASDPAIDVSETPITVRGRVGSLPKTGVRRGDAIASRESWPRVAVWPTLADLQQSLGRELQPFVLLMDPDDDNGYLRHWVPEEMGPGKHFGYALQWFAMAAALAGILIWNFRKKTFAT